MHSNRLINETSPYLLQHAHNPVDWYPWGEEALEKARKQNKPILVSIGYAACHWCHVMERESFEDPEVAAVMNQHFVNIKIDREERPDLDHIYMDAVQVMTGSGGWPLNVFLTPDAKPFYGGTYFPPKKAFNRPSWSDVLYGVMHAFAEQRQEVLMQANGLTEHLQKNNLSAKPGTAIPDPGEEMLHLIFSNLMQSADKAEGGFGRAPKFPQTFSIQYLLRYYHYYKNQEALDQACLSLDKMIYGGIYDQVGGGFARYSTDASWLVPHFEKMLYDNALLVTTLSEAYQITGFKRYAVCIDETMAFIERELLSPEGGFYAALDADSEGEEGKYYVWTKSEIEQLLGADAALFCAYYDVTDSGNWEGKNILNVTKPPEAFTTSNGFAGTVEDQQARLKEARRILLEARKQRIPPLLDDKLLLGWNALMNTACSKAWMATGNERYRKLAVRNMDFLLGAFADGEGFRHSYKNGLAKQAAFVDDYAFLIQALIRLQEITGNHDYLTRAGLITAYVLGGFWDEESAVFFFTHQDQQDVIMRKRDLYDGALPSGNSVMAGNLVYLSHVFDKRDWQEKANQSLDAVADLVVRYPGSFGNWAMQWMTRAFGVDEIVVTGTNFNEILTGILHIFNPAAVVQSSSVPLEKFPLLHSKQYTSPALVYLCSNNVCQPAVDRLDSYMQLIKK